MEVDESHFKIDQYNLDLECIEQPSLYHGYAEDLAQAKRALEEVSNEEKVIKAEVELDIRDAPGKYGLEKLTEALIASVAYVAEECKSARAAVIEARHRVDVLGAAVSSLDQKKRSLEMLVSLHGQGYFSEVKMDYAGKEAVQEQTKRAVRGKKKKRSRVE